MNALNALLVVTMMTLPLHASSSNSLLTNIQPSVEVGDEFCHYDTFRGRCWRGEVLVMTRALWGRMKIGRCVEIHPNFMDTHGKDPLFLGCFADVLQIADRKCSGKPECDIKIPDPEFDNIKPCYTGLTTYFEASFRCVRVVQESRTCVVYVTNEQQFISTSSSLRDLNTASACGSRSSPWHVEASLGQRIDIGLLDFTASSNTSRARYGYVIEKASKKNVSIGQFTAVGGAKRPRDSAVYTSDTNSVGIVLGETVPDYYNLLISLQAIGCTNMIPPDNAWLKRSNNDIVIGCYLSQQTWQLKCDGHEWKGQVGTCPATYDGLVMTTTQRPTSEVNTGVVAMIMIAGSTIFMCIAVVGIGCCCLKQYKREAKEKCLYKSEKHETLLMSSFHANNDCVSNLPATRVAPPSDTNCINGLRGMPTPTAASYDRTVGSQFQQNRITTRNEVA